MSNPSQIIKRMEKIINKNIQDYVTNFKSKINDKVQELDFNEKDKINKLLECVFEHHRFVLKKEDLMKPKRVKTDIPCDHRCMSKLVNGEQCTRRKNKDGDYCGTHVKVVRPNSFVADVNVETKKSIKVYAENIHGIIYYIDEYLNVYNTEDILNEKEDPHIVAKAEKKGDKYIIPAFDLF